MIVHNKPTNIVIKKSLGAPTGLRWHWFRWCFLNSKLKNFYELIYDYTKKIGVSRRYDWEIFSVTRTSKQCYRCMYTDVLMGEVKYFTAQSPEKLLRKMAKITKISTMPDKVSGK